MCNVSEYCQGVLHRDFTSLHAHQECMWLPIALHPYQPECIWFFVVFFFKGSGFVANINIWAKAFCPAFFFFLKASLSLWMSLSSLLLYRYVHDTKPCLLPCLSLKALILAFSYCSRFSSLVVSICKKKKKKGNSWVSILTEYHSPQCRGSLNLCRSDYCCQYILDPFLH